MESIIILPKDVSVAFMPEQNTFEIKINKDTMIKDGNLLIENLYDGLEDIITCNEINPTTDTWLAYDSNIYILAPKNIIELKETGETIISYHGTIKENVDLEIESDIEFVKWYYSVDTIEEAIEIMK